MRLYVDDMFMAIPREEVNNILNYFNSVDKKIQFTMEVEVNGCLPFLDVMVVRSMDGCLQTNWYTKPTSSGRLINFMSNHPISQKASVALGLLHRAINLSHDSFYEENIKLVKQMLKNNNYPPEFIDICVNKFKQNQDRVRMSENKYFFKFPYVRGLSQHILRAFVGTEWKPANYNIKTVGNIYTRLKDKVNEDLMSELVYAIPCECGKKYVGQIKQYLKNRTNQHRLDCRPVNILKSEQTALARHHFDTGHNFDFSSVSIL
ncbi:GSCOCG00012374001-RA-CDS, partial [Cotesia congregata]